MENILNDLNIGLWSIHLSDDESKMYGDEVMHRLLGVEESLSAEELYDFWFERIDLNYVEYVQEAIQKILAGKSSVVEYPWNHPKLGLIYIRCGGVCKYSQCGRYEISGYHQDITKDIDENRFIKNKYHTVDIYKMKQYSSYFIDLYEELYEIDIETLKTSTIFSKSGKYKIIKEGTNIFELIDKYVHEEDKDKFKEVFLRERINQMIHNKETIEVEFRSKVCENKFKWVKAICFIAELNSRKKFLFFTYDIHEEKMLQELSKEKKEIIDALVSTKASVVNIDLDSEYVHILKYEENDKEVKEYTTLDDFKYKFISEYIEESSEKEILNFLSLDKLKSLAVNKKRHNINVKLKNERFFHKWLTVSVLPLENSEDKIFLLIGCLEHGYLAECIMKKYVYKNCDYLYFLDLRNNWFQGFVGDEEESQILVEEGTDYLTRMIFYADHFVVEEDRDMVKMKMSPEYVLKYLNKHDVLSFTLGVVGQSGKYARKLIQFQYYDKNHDVVLFTRIDITESYFSNKQKKLELEEIHRIAHNDSLTNILNRLGIEKAIEDYINQNEVLPMSAFMLFDLDNFKMVNDKMGHQEGDKLLQKVACFLRENFRSTDIVGRLGGDEFIVFIKNVSHTENILLTAKKIVDELCFNYKYEDGSFKVSTSLGVAIAPMHGTTFNELYKKADIAMYNSKKMGKQTYYIYNSQINVS